MVPNAFGYILKYMSSFHFYNHNWHKSDNFVLMPNVPGAMQSLMRLQFILYLTRNTIFFVTLKLLTINTFNLFMGRYNVERKKVFLTGISANQQEMIGGQENRIFCEVRGIIESHSSANSYHIPLHRVIVMDLQRPSLLLPACPRLLRSDSYMINPFTALSPVDLILYPPFHLTFVWKEYLFSSMKGQMYSRMQIF